jgi:outer membrane protein OmpA-like peptidoglycan-associated protein
MSNHGLLRRWIILAPIFVGVFSSDAHTQDPASSEHIVRKLLPSAPQTRSIRGVTVTPGTQTALPSIDLYINFEFDSAKLDSNGIVILQSLGGAIKDPRLRGYLFQIAGHTDAVGDDPYNKRLSEARAQTVRDYLIRQFGVSSDVLSAVGFGKSRLLDASRPSDAINRRVQITNLGP